MSNSGIPQPMSSGATDNPNAPQSGDDTVHVKGPDGKVYRFPKGTDKTGAINYFKRKGIAAQPAQPKTIQGQTASAPTPTTPQQAAKPPAQPGYFERTSAESNRRAQVAADKAYGITAQPGIMGAPSRMGNAALSLAYDTNAVASDILGGVLNLKNLAIGVGGGLVNPLIPASYFGGEALRDIPEHATRMLHDPTPANVRAFYETAATLAFAGAGAGEAGGKAGPLGDKIKPTPEGLRQRAAELNTKALKQADAAARDYKTSAGLQVAQERIMGTMRQLPDKIEAVRVAKDVAVKRSIAQAQAQGVTIDVANDIMPIVGDTMQVLNQRGQLDSTTVHQVRGLLDQITKEVDPQASAAAGKVVTRPVDLTRLSPDKAMALIKGLEDEARFGKNAPTALQNLARRLRGALNDRVGQKLPDVQRLRAEESRLITARDAARTNYERLLNDKTSMGRGILYSGAGTLGMYLALRGLGVMPMASIGGVVLTSALARSTPSRTIRAALYAQAADMMEGKIRQQTGPQGPQGAAGASAGGLPPMGPTVPQGPVGGPTKGLTGGAMQLGAGGPMSSAAAGGSGTAAGAAFDSMLFQQAKQQLGESASISDVAKRAQEMKLEHLAKQGKQSGAQPTTSSPAGGETDVEETIRRAQPQAGTGIATTVKGVGDKIGTPEEQARVKKAMEGRETKKSVLEEGQSGMSPKAKAMMDRLDALYDRQAAPKSGADRNAIAREINEIEQVLSGEAQGKELSAINKRIADRERLASKRATAASQGGKEGQPAAGQGEGTASSASPETRAIALDAGYKKLSTYEGGAEMVKALRKMAKELRSVDPGYDEVEKLTEALEIMRKVTGD